MRKLLTVFLLIGLSVPGPAFAQSDTDKSAVYDQLNLFGEAYERIRQDAVDPVSDKRLVDTAIAGMLSSLDPHSMYISESAYKALQSPGKADEGSIGLVATIREGELTVVSPRDGSPAAKAGIRPGDMIFTIDKEPTYELTLAEAEQRLRGPIDSTVSLVLRRGDSQILNLKIKRATPALQAVTGSIAADDIGYLRIAGFDAGTPALLKSAVEQLQQQGGARLAGYIIDLRDNPGGDFKAAVATADAFLDKGDITVIKGRTKADDKTIPATPGDIAHGLPIVVLVNGGTASESELVAAALQDNHRAELLGTKTFGESAIESVIPLPGGDGAIRVTTARFLTPNGQPIQGKGLTPNLTVTPVKVETLAEIDQIREIDLPGALKNPDAAAKAAAAPPAKAATSAKSPAVNVPAGTVPAAAPKTTSPSLSSREIGGKNDQQLAEAIDVLHGLAIVSERGAH